MNTPLDKQTKELVAIAAAVAGKCQPCFAYHFKQAQELGISQEQIDETVQLAKDIRASGDKHMDEFAQRRLTGTTEDIK
jgi:AhpD family alkylhydroperoxidase